MLFLNILCVLSCLLMFFIFIFIFAKNQKVVLKSDAKLVLIPLVGLTMGWSKG
jgi:hypothetical protein